VLADGRIVERGSHVSLLEAGGLYATMWQRQALSAAEREQRDAVEAVPSA